jgi:hypothetical protein
VPNREAGRATGGVITIESKYPKENGPSPIAECILGDTSRKCSQNPLDATNYNPAEVTEWTRSEQVLAEVATVRRKGEDSAVATITEEAIMQMKITLDRQALKTTDNVEPIHIMPNTIILR